MCRNICFLVLKISRILLTERIKCGKIERKIFGQNYYNISEKRMAL